MASNQAPVVDRIRIIPRSQDFLNRNVGSSGEVFFNRETSSLRLYNGNDRGGYDVVTLDRNGNLDLKSQKNKIRAHWDTLTDLQTEVDPVVYHGMVAHVHAEGRIYFAHAGEWIGVANQGEASGGASVDVSATPPLEPVAGSIWFNANTGKLYVYVQDGDSNQWVQPASLGNTVPDVNAFASIKLGDSSELNAVGLDTITFVDGPGIEITNDSTNNTIIISATGGGGGGVTNYNELTNLPTLVTSYNQLTDTPSIPSNIDDLSDVDTTTLAPTANQALLWDDGTSNWKPGDVSVYDQSLNTTDDVVFNTVEATAFTNTGVGDPEINSASTITLTAPDGVNVSSFLQLTALDAAPLGISTGAIAVADRTNWDPAARGTGAAYPVFYDGTSWIDFASA